MQSYPDDRTLVEKAIREACLRGDYDAAATAAVEAYGAEVFGFLCAQVTNREDAADVFSDFSERLWKSLPTFEWRCSARTWAYKLARNAAFQHQRGERRHVRTTHLTHPSQLLDAVQRERSRTADYQRTEIQNRFAALRKHLPEADQALLVLRIDRKMSWLDLAEVLSDGALEPDTRKREAARLRKRFESVKERLRTLATRSGLLQSD